MENSLREVQQFDNIIIGYRERVYYYNRYIAVEGVRF